MPPALLFDLDGTICETDWAHLKAFEIVFGDLGIAMNEAIFKASILGASNAMIAEAFLPQLPARERNQILDRKEEVYRDLVDTVEPVAGLVALLDLADRAGAVSAIVTNAPRQNADKIIGGLGLSHRFKAIVCGQELERGKPDPLAYLEGLRLTGGDPARSCAFEDSPSGIKAGIGAGLPVIGLATNLNADALLNFGAVLAAPDFTDQALLDFVNERIASA